MLLFQRTNFIYTLYNYCNENLRIKEFETNMKTINKIVAIQTMCKSLFYTVFSQSRTARMANKGKRLGAGHGEPSPKSETVIYGV